MTVVEIPNVEDIKKQIKELKGRRKKMKLASFMKNGVKG